LSCRSFTPLDLHALSTCQREGVDYQHNLLRDAGARGCKTRDGMLPPACYLACAAEASESRVLEEPGCSAVQCCAVLCSAVLCSAAQRSAARQNPPSWSLLWPPPARCWHRAGNPRNCTPQLSASLQALSGPLNRLPSLGGLLMRNMGLTGSLPDVWAAPGALLR